MTNQVKLAIVVLWVLAIAMVGEAVLAGYLVAVLVSIAISLVVSLLIVKSRRAVS